MTGSRQATHGQTAEADFGGPLLARLQLARRRRRAAIAAAGTLALALCGIAVFAFPGSPATGVDAADLAAALLLAALAGLAWIRS